MFVYKLETTASHSHVSQIWHPRGNAATLSCSGCFDPTKQTFVVKERIRQMNKDRGILATCTWGEKVCCIYLVHPARKDG